MVDFIENPEHKLGDKVIFISNNKIGKISRVYYDTKVSYWRYDVMTKNDIITDVGEMRLTKTIENNIEYLEAPSTLNIVLVVMAVLLLCCGLFFLLTLN